MPLDSDLQHPKTIDAVRIQDTYRKGIHIDLDQRLSIPSELQVARRLGPIKPRPSTGSHY